MGESIKVKINAATGKIDLQCNEKVFFKAMKECRKVLKTYARKPHIKSTEQSSSPTKPLAKKAPNTPTKTKKTPPSSPKTKKGYNPKLVTSLDLLKLPEFYEKYIPSNHPEKILIFTMFLKDVLSVSPCTIDDVYSCYLKVKNKTKTPKAFLQAFRDAASSDYGYIEFSLTDGIKVPIHGSNHFEHDLKRSDNDE